MGLFRNVYCYSVPVVVDIRRLEDSQRYVGGLGPPDQLRKDHMTEGEQHTHEETVKDEHTNEDGTVSTEKTETTEAETNGDDE